MKRGIPNDLLHIFSDPKDLNAQSDSAIPPTNTIPLSAEKSSSDSKKSETKEQPAMQSATDKITSSPAGSNTRIMAFTELADGEHTVNGKTFTKSGSAFTLDGKTLNAKEIEKATRTKTEKIKAKPRAEEKPSDQSDKSDKSEKVDESGNTALFSTVGDRGMEQKSKKQKSSTFAKSSTGLSQPFPDYRGLADNEQSIASAALQSVEHGINITPNNDIVNKAINEIIKYLKQIKDGRHFSAPDVRFSLLSWVNKEVQEGLHIYRIENCTREHLESLQIL